MTASESRALTKGTRVYWQGNVADSGIIRATSWDAVTIAWDNGHIATVHHGDMREIERTVDEAAGGPTAYEDAESAFAGFGAQLAAGTKRLNSILGRRTGVKFIRLEKPARLRLRFGEKRISLELDEVHQLVFIDRLARELGERTNERDRQCRRSA